MPDHIESGSSSHSSAFQRPKQEEGVIADDNTIDETPQQSKPNFFTIYKDASEIAYVPEDALKEGLGMVKTIKQTLTRLELSSKLRAEVWDRELSKLVYRYFYADNRKIADLFC